MINCFFVCIFYVPDLLGNHDSQKKQSSDIFLSTVESRGWYFRPNHHVLLAKKTVVIQLW